MEDRVAVPYMELVPPKRTVDADLVIVGAGIAGLMAAIQAHDAGVRVALFEMHHSPYYSESAICGGGMALPGTDLQSRQGISDSSSLLHGDMLRVGRFSNNDDVVEAFCENVLEAHRELVQLGAVCAGLEYTGGHSVPRIHKHDPMQVIHALMDQVDRRQIRVFWNTRVLRLVLDPLTGRVLGVRTSSKKEQFFYSEAVLLATGGMCGSVELLRRYVPSRRLLATRVAFGGGSVDLPVGLGEGLTMAMAIGADTTHLYGVSTYTGIPHPHIDGYSDRSGRPWFPSYQEGAIAVDKNGYRFTNEPGTAPCEIGDELQHHPEQVLFKVCDADAWKRMASCGGPGDPRNIPEKHVWVCDSLERLAERAGIRSEQLVKTVERYNKQVQTGVDKDFGRDAKYTFPIESPPFIAHKNWVIALHSCGGLRINSRFQVLNVFGEVMPGLYAAGEVAGGLSGEVYLTGTHYAAAMTSGYLAGRIVGRGFAERQHAQGG